MTRSTPILALLALPVFALALLTAGCVRVEVNYEEEEETRDAVVMTFGETATAVKSAILKSMLDLPGSHGGRWEGDDLVVFIRDSTDQAAFRKALRAVIPDDVELLGIRVEEDRPLKKAEEEQDGLLPRNRDADSGGATGADGSSPSGTRRGPERGPSRGTATGTERGTDR